ncbi:dihydrofolate reductase-like domain-containing protein [Flammula alnicola]|nr:dihydrofolate reductase-like domain-containing protein [Flammula alnicola]
MKLWKGTRLWWSSTQVGVFPLPSGSIMQVSYIRTRVHVHLIHYSASHYHRNGTSPPAFLDAVLKPRSNSPSPTRPHVTLTFAQSLDAKIAGAEGRQLILSGKESMVMTHCGGRELVRHLPQPTSTPYHLPRPIIIDTHLRLPPTCKLLKNFQNKIGRRPWVVCSVATDEVALRRKETLEAAGARIIEISSSSSSGMTSNLPILSILQKLRDLGINSLMVEGGARIIASFLAESVVNALIITIAPVLVGHAGVGYQYPTLLSENGEIVAKFKEVHTELMGRDTVVSLVSCRNLDVTACK